MSGRTAIEWKQGAFGNDPAQAVGRLQREDAAPFRARAGGLEDVELDGFAGLVAQLLERLSGQHPQRAGIGVAHVARSVDWPPCR